MQPLLIILDLNGTLLHRTNKKMPPRFVKRPALNHFLERVTARHMVMVWSSAQPATVETICRQIFTPVQYTKLVAIWNRTHLGLPEELYRNKVQVYKQLERVWADKKIQSQYPNNKHRCGKPIHHVVKYKPHIPMENEMTGVNNLRWDQSNTVLIDDSRLKAAANPHNIFLSLLIKRRTLSSVFSSALVSSFVIACSRFLFVLRTCGPWVISSRAMSRM